MLCYHIINNPKPDSKNSPFKNAPSFFIKLVYFYDLPPELITNIDRIIIHSSNQSIWPTHVLVRI